MQETLEANEGSSRTSFALNKRLGKISRDDWLRYTMKFLESYDSNYPSRSNLEIKDVADKRRYKGHTVGGNVLKTILAMPEIKIDREIEENIKGAIPADKFLEYTNVITRLEPAVKENTGISHFAEVSYSKRAQNKIGFYAQADRGAIRKLYYMMEQRTMKERMSFGLSKMF
jgi:hypothetical protein